MEMQYSDLKFYWNIHRNRMKNLGKQHVSYSQFSKRLRKMNLHDAIYTPSTVYRKPRKTTTPIEDNIRRTQTLKEQNVQVLDTLIKVETIKPPKNKVNMKPKKNTIRNRFISLFKS